MGEERKTELTVMEQKDDTLVKKYQTFPLGYEMYGLEIRHITEIAGIQHAGYAPLIRGVINLWAKAFPFVAVRSRFGLHYRDAYERRRQWGCW